MNRNTLLTIAGLGVLAYLIFGRKPKAKEIGQAPDVNTGTKIIEGIDGGTAAETTATLRAKGVRVPKRKLVMVEEIKVPVKEPIRIAAANVIPNVYDRGINEPLDFVSANGQSFYNMSGRCTENIQKACGCVTKENKDKYYFEVPQLP